MSKYPEVPNKVALNQFDRIATLEQFDVLEIGCNSGYNLEELLKRHPNASCYGCDIDQEMINRAKGKECFDPSHFEVVDLENNYIPFVFNKFDYILAFDVLEHLRNPVNILKTLRGHLKSTDSKILAAIPNILHYSVLKDMIIRGSFTYTETGLLDNTHIHFFTLKEMLKTFEEAGYIVDQYVNVTLDKKFYPLLPWDDEFIKDLKAIRNKFIQPGEINVESDFEDITYLIVAHPNMVDK